MAAEMKRGATLRNAQDLIGAGLAQEGARAGIDAIGARYAIAVTPHIARLARSDGDAIARQFAPDERELVTLLQERADPIGDKAHSPVSGVVHRYADRALLKIVGACPVYCRFCFRREMVGPGRGENLSAEEFARALDYFRATPAIREVILTGGDPLILSPRRVREATAALSAIPHLQKLRWHTRVPVVDPERVTAELVAALTATGKRIVVAIHANHAQEFSEAARRAIERLRVAGVSLLSQSVLLKCVNDDADALDSLMRAFADNGVAPYYLHHGDLAPGTAHFRTTIAVGRALMRELATRLPGHVLPRYMLDIPGGYGKIDLMAPSVMDLGDGACRVVDRFGAAHVYRDAVA
ncbi:MAG: lysine-2,3-aminomutase-like protein [Hyphomicrobium sp.]